MVTRVIGYLMFLFRARGLKGHGIHSPFVFHRVLGVLRSARARDDDEKFIVFRRWLFADKRTFRTDDKGAGSGTKSWKGRRVCVFARSASIRPKHARLLAALVREFSCRNIIELGTGTGLSAAGMALADPQARVITIEGSDDLVLMARENFERWQFPNITVIRGWFDDLLPGVMDEMDSVDLAFIDGNHRKEATEKYVRLIMAKAHENTVIAIHDVHASRGMTKAWAALRSDERVSLSVDLFHMGLLFFKTNIARQEFVIKY